MKISASDPDIETLVGRIVKNELNLRPDFQRGEVWSEAKRQKLIDTILRGWQVPPIHLVSLHGTSELEVLDGQQRLAAIRDFAANQLRIDGKTKPLDKDILALDGRRFASLPPPLQRRFNQYPIRVFTITEYEPDEPYELFYRLNQPTTLTASEQRNAFFGKAREQVKGLVSLAQEIGLDRDSIGFSNGRMAYDDVLARACMFSEAKTFHARVTAATLNDKYRSDAPFPQSAIGSVESALRLFALALATHGSPVRLNKATLLTWLLFTADNGAIGGDGQLLASYIRHFEELKTSGKATESREVLLVRQWIQLFEDRASSRVNDTLSVASRDFVLWLFFAGSQLSPTAETKKYTTARDGFNFLKQSAEDNRYLDPSGVVQGFLDRRAWDLSL
jgi:hypothetical protein